MMTPPQPAPLLPPMLLLALILVLLLLAPLPLTDSIAEQAKERGSRSTGPATTGALASLASLGNASAAGRDFRSTTASHSNVPPPTATSVYTSDDIDGDLIGGHVKDSLASDGLMWNKTGEWGTRTWEDQRMKTSRNDKSLADSFVGGPEKALRRRNRRQGEAKLWIKGDQVDAGDEVVKMHVLVVKDEDIPDCGRVADKYTRTRYYMCSGAILNANRVLTSATCVNRAQIHKYNVQAEIGVLIGAIAQDSYVIKVNRIIIHPNYIPDPNSPNHALNNIAMLMLACPIPRQLLAVPKLPFELWTDVGHMCCPDRCKVLTVVEDITLNYHFLKFLQTKHLPLPLHDYELPGTLPKSLLNSSTDVRSTLHAKNKKPIQPRTRTQVREKREIKKKQLVDHFANAFKKFKLTDDKEKVDMKKSEISFRDSDLTDVEKSNNDETAGDKNSKLSKKEKNEPNNDETAEDKNSNLPKKEKNEPNNDETAEDKNSQLPKKEKNEPKNDESAHDKNSNLPKNEESAPKNDETDDDKNSESPKNEKNEPNNDETANDKNSKSTKNEKNAPNNDETTDDKNEKNVPNNDKTADDKESNSPKNEKNVPKNDETGDDKDQSTAKETKIDWKKMYSELSEKTVSEDTKKHILKLTQDAVSKAMEDLADTITEYAVNLDNVFPYFEKILKDDLQNDASPDSVALTKKINKNIGNTLLMYGLQKLSKPNTDDSSGTLETEKPKDTELVLYSNCSSHMPVLENVYCPPLGSPVIADNILVGLIVYTCDDLQKWVEWKYVDIIRNLDWIKKNY